MEEKIGNFMQFLNYTSHINTFIINYFNEKISTIDCEYIENHIALKEVILLACIEEEGRTNDLPGSGLVMAHRPIGLHTYLSSIGLKNILTKLRSHGFIIHNASTYALTEKGKIVRNLVRSEALLPLLKSMEEDNFKETWTQLRDLYKNIAGNDHAYG